MKKTNDIANELQVLAEESAGGLSNSNEPVNFCYERQEHIEGFINGWNKCATSYQSLEESNAALILALDRLIHSTNVHGRPTDKVMEDCILQLNKAKNI